MYKKNSDLINPKDENIKIWRYLDFAKYVSLLDKSALFFSRADKLGDPFEGSFPIINARQRKIVQEKLLANMPQELRHYLPTSESQVEFLKNTREFVFINSWHENEQESAAMWSHYLRSTEGIAIQSTFACLRDCFEPNTRNIYISELQYIDYSNQIILENSLYSQFLYKRNSFKHEQELRAFTYIDDKDGFEDGFLNIPKHSFQDIKEGLTNIQNLSSQDGIYVNVNLDKLIQNIYVAPNSPKWLFDLVVSITKKYNLNKPMLQSGLDEKPVY